MNSSKIILTSAALIFGFSLVLISALRLSFQSGELGKAIVLAQEGMIMEEKVEGEEVEMDLGEEEATQAAELKEIEIKEVDYYLAYPGILPDHPLYWLKMARDRILLLLTNDPLQKFDRLLLYADKRLGAAKVLIEGNQPALGVTTATKAEKYLERSLKEFNKLRQAEKAIPELEDRFEKALLKHAEVIEKLLEKIPDQTKPALENSLEISKLGYESIRDKEK